MKIVIAIDSFKGSMTSMEAGTAVRDAVMNICNDVQAIIKPVADGGEGMTEALTYGLGGSFVYTDVTGPLGDPVRARYGILPDKATAVMEMAEAAGITRVKEKDPWNASTYGVGEMIIDAVSRGIRTFIMGIGGSATTDGGTGMLKALGIKFLDETGNEISEGAGDLDRIAEIDTEGMLSELSECEFRVACDVKNPLYGENGAVYIFGPQKGVKESEKAILDAKMRHYASMTEKATGADHSCDEGAGAAGGLGFAFSSFFPHVKLQSGIKIALQAIELEAEMTDADLVITGEGRLDGQTAMGKVPVGIAKLAKKYDVPVIAFAGCIGDGAELCRKEGIDDFFAITPEGMELETAMKKDVAENNMKKTVERELLLFMDKKGMKL